MKQYSKILLGTMFLLAHMGICQTPTVKKEIFYTSKGDPAIKEVFYVKKSDPNIIHGTYKSFFLNGNTQAEGEYYEGGRIGVWDYFFENGNIKMKGDYTKTDTVTWSYFYESGKPRMTGAITRTKKTGIWEFFFENGKLKSTGEYAHGKKIGEWLYFFEDGYQKATTNFIGNIGEYEEYFHSGTKKREGFIIDNRSDSIWTEFYESGEKEGSGPEKNGLKNGIWTYYWKNGKMKSKGSYHEGKQIGNWKYYDKKGVVKAEGAHKDGYKTGRWIMYSASGKVIGEGAYVDGEGPYKEYYEESGQLKIDGYVKRDKNEGKWKFYTKSGELERVCEFTENIGNCIGYYPDGTKSMEGNMEGSRETGTWTHYDSDGNANGYKKYHWDDGENVAVTDSAQEMFSWEEFADDPEYEFKSDVQLKIPKKHRNPWLQPIPNEYKGFILSANPIAVFTGHFPVSFEYYMERPLGIEVSYSYVQDPFFRARANLEPEEIKTTGYEVASRLKLYMKPAEANQLRSATGLLYAGAEVRYGNLRYESHVIDTALGKINADASAWRIELTAIVGDRVLGRTDRPGFTFDIFMGLGVGYQNYQENVISNTASENVFNRIKANGFIVPVRFAFSFGYLF